MIYNSNINFINSDGSLNIKAVTDHISESIDSDPTRQQIRLPIDSTSLAVLRKSLGVVNNLTPNGGVIVPGSALISGRIASTLSTAINEYGNFISSSLNTQTKTVLSDFTFGSADYSGGFKTGDITWNTTTGAITGGSGLVITKKGIIGASAGVPTFSIDGTTGSATFAGTISASQVVSGTFTGLTFQTAASGQKVIIDGVNNNLRFYDSAGQVIGIGTEASRAIDIFCNGTMHNGVLITSNQAGNGFYYTNTTDIGARGVYVEQTSNGSNNIHPCVELHHDGHYWAQFIQATHESGGILIDQSGVKDAIQIINTGTGSSIELLDQTTGSGTTPALDISYARAGAGINIRVTHAGGDPTGIKMAIENSSGNEYAFDFGGSEIVSAAVTGTQNKKIRVLINPGGAVYYIPLYDA